jgi:hypothetical protein
MRSKSGVFLVWRQLVVLRVQTLESFLTVLGKVWSADRRDCPSEESWLPLLLCCLSLRGLLPLLLLDLGLEVCRQSILLAYYGICNTVPEFERLIGKLLVEWWDDFSYRVEWVEVDD